MPSQRQYLEVQRMTTRALWEKLYSELMLLEGQIDGTLDPTDRLHRVRRVRQIAHELKRRGTQLHLVS